MNKKHNFVAVACARWETDWITEWLIYNRHIGFDHVYIYCNDDDPRELYRELLPFVQRTEPFVTFYHFGLIGQQSQMYLHFLRNHLDDCERYMFVDVDEFILMRHCEHLPDFLRSLGVDPDALQFYPVAAGHNGHVERPSGLAIKNFTRRRATVGRNLKNLVRSDAVDRGRLAQGNLGLFWHDVEPMLKPASSIINVLGEDMRGFHAEYEVKWAPRYAADNDFHARCFDAAVLYHIGMKSERDMMRRFERGAVGDFAPQAQWKDLHDKGRDAVLAFLRPHNAIEERRLVEVWDKIENGALALQIVPASRGPNIALAGQATQSSDAQEPVGQAQDLGAKGLISGRLSAHPQHRTAIEDRPWWMLDLGASRRFGEIRIFDSIGAAEGRLYNFTISTGDNPADLKILFDKADHKRVGGVDGQPFILRLDKPVEAQFIKITRGDRGHLSMSQIEVYA